MAVSVKSVSVVLGYEITVAWVGSRRSAAVIIRSPSGEAYHEQVDLPPAFAAALSPDAALEWVTRVVAIGIKGAEIPKKH